VVPFYDRSTLIERAVGTVESALLEATVLVVILLLLFLGELRAALVVAVMVPLAALGTFLLMRLVGMSANLMSLGGSQSPSACWWMLPWWWWKTPSVGSTRTRPVRTSRACTAYSPRRARSPCLWPRASSSSV
jgi:hypothetical protein